MTNETIFSKIISKEIPADIVFEDDLVIAFKDIKPAAKTHILVIPKSNHLKNINDMQENDKELLGHILLKISKIAKTFNLDKNGYRVITNSGDFAGQEVFHLHFHILGDEYLKELN